MEDVLVADAHDNDAPAHVAALAPELCVVIPTYNESANVGPLVDALDIALEGLRFELIFVDDDSPDDTAAAVDALAAKRPWVRCIRRIGRRGLASAVVEGALATSAPFVAVMDADFQHDEKLLPDMLRCLRGAEHDIVVGSRYAEGGGLGAWDAGRQRMSALATLLSRLVTRQNVTDSMSGFFMVRRDFFLATVRDLSQQGYKILLDLLASAATPPRVLELAYTFRNRREGESKLDNMVLVEYATLLFEKLTRGLVPGRFLMFGFTGGLGLLVHLSVLTLLQQTNTSFLAAQLAATVTAMVFNFTVNNTLTYRDVRLRGVDFFAGLAVFVVICSVGAVANLSIAQVAVNATHNWTLSGALGALMSTFFNFGMSSRFVWGRKSKRKTA